VYQQDGAAFRPGTLTGNAQRLQNNPVAFVNGIRVEAKAPRVTILGVREDRTEPPAKDQEEEAVYRHG